MTEFRLQFDCDPAKAAANLRKHGVSFDEAATAFFDLNAISYFDADHSSGSGARFVNIGISTMGRLLFVVHNEEGDTIRIISARLAVMAEKTLYEEA